MVLLFLLALCGAVVSHDPLSRWTQEQLDFLANLKYEDIPRHIQMSLSRTRTSQVSGYCCKANIDKLVPYHTVTRVVPKTHIVAVTNHGTVGYEQKVTTFIQHDTVPDKSVCPDNLIVCCRNHILVGDACFDVTNGVIHSVDDLVHLHEQGVIGR